MTARQWFDLGAAWTALCEAGDQLRQRNAPALAKLADRLARDVYQLAGRIVASEPDNMRKLCLVCGRTGQVHYTGEASDCSAFRADS